MFLDYSSRDEFADINTSFAEKYIEILYIERLEEPGFRLDYLKSRAKHVSQLQDLQVKDLEGNLGWLSYLHGIILSREQMEERMPSLLKCSTLYMVEFNLKGCSPEDAFCDEAEEGGMKEGRLREAIRHTYMDFLEPCERVIEALQNHFVLSRPTKICSFSQFDFVQKLLYQELYPTSRGRHKTHAGLVMMPIKFPASFNYAISDKSYAQTDIKVQFHKWTGLKTGGSLFRLKGKDVRPSLVPNRIISVWNKGKPEQMFKHYSKLFELGQLSFTGHGGDETTIIMKELGYRSEKRNEKVSQIGTTLPPRSSTAVGSEKEEQRSECRDSSDPPSVVGERKVSFAEGNTRSNVKEEGSNCSRSLNPAPDVGVVVHCTEDPCESNAKSVDCPGNMPTPAGTSGADHSTVSSERETSGAKFCVNVAPDVESGTQNASDCPFNTVDLTMPPPLNNPETLDANLCLDVKPNVDPGHKVNETSNPGKLQCPTPPQLMKEQKDLAGTFCVGHDTDVEPDEGSLEVSNSCVGPMNGLGTATYDLPAVIEPRLVSTVPRSCSRSHELDELRGNKQVDLNLRADYKVQITSGSAAQDHIRISSVNTRKSSGGSYRSRQANKQVMMIDGVEHELNEIERDIFLLLETRGTEKEATKKLSPSVKCAPEERATKAGTFTAIRDEQQLFKGTNESVAIGTDEASISIKDGVPKRKPLPKIEALMVPDLSPEEGEGDCGELGSTAAALPDGFETQEEFSNQDPQHLPQSHVMQYYYPSENRPLPSSFSPAQQEADEYRKRGSPGQSLASSDSNASSSSDKNSNVKKEYPDGIAMAKVDTKCVNVTDLERGSKTAANQTSSSERGRHSTRRKERRKGSEARKAKEYVESDISGTLPLSVCAAQNDRVLAQESVFGETSIIHRKDDSQLYCKTQEPQNETCRDAARNSENSPIYNSQPIGGSKSSDAFSRRPCHCHLKEKCHNPFHDRLPEFLLGDSLNPPQEYDTRVNAVDGQSATRSDDRQSREARTSFNIGREQVNATEMRQEPNLPPNGEHKQRRPHLHPGSSVYHRTMIGHEEKSASRISDKDFSLASNTTAPNTFDVLANERSIRNFIYGTGQASSLENDAKNDDQGSVIISSHLFPPLATSQAPRRESMTSKGLKKNINPSEMTHRLHQSMTSGSKGPGDDFGGEERYDFCYDSRDAIKSCELSTVDQIFGKHGFHQNIEQAANVKSLDRPESMFSFCSGPTIGSPLSSQLDAAVNEHLSNCAKGLYDREAIARCNFTTSLADDNGENPEKPGKELHVYGPKSQKNSSQLPCVTGEYEPDMKTPGRNRSLRFANKIKSVVSPRSGCSPTPARPIKKEKRKLTYDELYPALSNVRFRDFVKFKAHKLKEDFKYFSDMAKIYMVDTKEKPVVIDRASHDRGFVW
ncbi:uncharacterized protein LALA0_S03e08922g [Lachancea lanzarotensis]|uniref:LALA0S03e08922g1_1 n=1 Tax=Lachancea lanzarotensis TaxID=1245769 RepID=A0A0C7MP91_9SACH|nr:uncharacterized protein LALA0_S03e08922g [Lachancea lanzarotensis]CEP61702.1 LALA0S03e08922g1_1 [Lachancea lanzarotensis]